MALVALIHATKTLQEGAGLTYVYMHLLFSHYSFVVPCLISCTSIPSFWVEPLSLAYRFYPMPTQKSKTLGLPALQGPFYKRAQSSHSAFSWEGIELLKLFNVSENFILARVLG